MKRYGVLFGFIFLTACTSAVTEKTTDDNTGMGRKNISALNAQIGELDRKLAVLETGEPDTLAFYLTLQDSLYISETLQQAGVSRINRILDEWLAGKNDDAINKELSNKESSDKPAWVRWTDQVAYADGRFYFVGIADGTLEMIASERSAANARVQICRYLAEELSPRFADLDKGLYLTVQSFRNSMTLTGTSVQERFMDPHQSKLKYYTLMTLDAGQIRANVLNNLLPAIAELTGRSAQPLALRILKADPEYVKNALRIKFLEEKIRLLEKIKSVQTNR